MRVIRARSAGFCWGVRRAVETAARLAEEAGGAGVFTDGPLIHNSSEVARLAALGVSETKNPESLPANSVLLVRAHGIPPSRMAALSALPVKLRDATCPKVSFIQKLCATGAAEGRLVIILGDPDHAEVVGLLGHSAGRGRVVTLPRDVETLPAWNGPVRLVSQSTQSPALFDEVAAAVLARWPDADIRNTICDATRARQGELPLLAEQCEAFVVVGSPESANTARLARLASSLRPTFVVEGSDELSSADFATVKSVALTAGASTPDGVIAAVEERLRSF